MVIYSPTPAFSKTDKRLLLLLSKLLLEQLDRDTERSNLPTDIVALTDAEAAELLDLMENLVNSREFAQACYFVEGVTYPESTEELQLREIYLSGRKRRGRTRALANLHWSDFKTRLGILKTLTWTPRTEPMTLDYFQTMEERLLRSAHLRPEVVNLVLRVIGHQIEYLDGIRSGQRTLKHGTVKELVGDPFFRWRRSRSHRDDLQIPANKIAAVITIVANISVLFTTRDWSVTGTLSTMAGAMAALSAK